MNRPANPIGFLRTTAIGGLLFLLPLIVIGALIGQVIPVVLTIAEALDGFLPVRTPGRIGLLILLALGVLLLLCFAAGLVAKWSFSKNLSEAFEKKLTILFPKYAILKDQMADTIGGEQSKPRMKPVLVKFDELMRIGFETERIAESDQVAVYLPGSPDPWSGKVVLVNAKRVESLAVDFGAVVTANEQLGRGSSELLSERRIDGRD